jgi:hypothetical protein
MGNPLEFAFIVYGGTVIISFFVVFVIKSVYSIMKFIKKN